MVRKLQSNEYLKRYDNMTAEERSSYTERVGEWLSSGARLLTSKANDMDARLKNVLQASVTWNDAECAAFETGVLLLSALIAVAGTLLPDVLYSISARRAVKKMFELLWDMEARRLYKKQEEKTEKPSDAAGSETDVHDGGKAVADGDACTAKEEPPVACSFQDSGDNGHIAVADKDGEAQVGTVPVRPKHIDQYVHLLPKKTQEHAAQVQGLYRELEDAREKSRLLMGDPKASAADREAWAKKVTKCDNALRKILDELDAGWAKLVRENRVMVDDLGNVRVVPMENEELTTDSSGPAELTSEQKARRRELRKWLTDTRRGNGSARDKHVAKWQDSFREYLTLEGGAAFADDKIVAAAKHYDINLEELKNS